MRTERSLIERVLQGEPEAFNLLVRQWEKPIYNFVLRMIGDREEAMDISQDVFLRVYNELHALRDLDRFSSWLYRIAHNACYSRLRKDIGRVHVPLDPDARSVFKPMENHIAVQNALGQLPEEQREVVTLKVYHGLKFEEIAAIQDAPVSTVKSRLYLAFEKLRLILE